MVVYMGMRSEGLVLLMGSPVHSLGGRYREWGRKTLFTCIEALCHNSSYVWGNPTLIGLLIFFWGMFLRTMSTISFSKLAGFGVILECVPEAAAASNNFLSMSNLSGVTPTFRWVCGCMPSSPF